MNQQPTHGAAMAAALASITGLTAQVSQATLHVHYPRCGRRRPYQSEGDCMAYESGFRAFSSAAQGPTSKTPFADGWNDAAALGVA